jgi:hypothetical protein
VIHVPSADNLADFFTKMLLPNKFEGLRDKIMVLLPIDMQQLRLQG